MYRLFENLIDPLQPRVVERPPTTTGAFFWHFLKPVKGIVLLALIVAGIAALSEVLVFVYLGRLVDWMTSESPEHFIAEHSVALTWMLIVVAIVRPVSLLGSRAMMNLALAPGIANATRWQNHRYVLRQSMGYFQNDFAGRVAQKVLQTGNALREAIISFIDGVWMLLIYLVSILLIFSDVDKLLLLPLIIWFVGYVAVVVWMVPPVRSKSAQLSEATSELTGRIVDSYTNIQSVKLFAHHELEEEFAGVGIRKHTQAFRQLMRAILDMTAALTIMNTLLVIATAWLSIRLWQTAAISIGSIALCNALVIRLIQMSGWILRTITALFENIGTVQNGMETIAQNIRIKDSENANTLSVTSGLVAFSDVSFHYDEQIDDPLGAVIDHCDFTVQPGEKVGLVGRSGAGKSTLVNLLLRFHDLEQGAIKIDGTDIRSVTQHSLRSNIAVVTQDTSLLHRSIRDNIRYGKPDATDAEILQAAERAQALDFIDSLKDQAGRRGLDAMTGERGVKLSGGQRQRIAIARVILKNAPILVLDEATSALDSEVESAIQQQLNQLMQGKTVLAVAHRLSTIAALDRLIVLDQGRIVESGSHQELIGASGLYAQLWNRQSGGFIGLSTH
ncbi:MAG: ABC transporter ATP-binding protein/permease [Gammaproteobacteria bacterium]|nr:ABC transporter ATP-binding protein/permease [Gammaproteobacteria bacterium]